jgi:diadenosine tetraphosphate (Ap4A) HIT family hydrolase
MNNLLPECLICRRQSRDDAGGYVVYSDDYWTVRHSSETNILGYLLLESRRHFLDLSGASPGEACTYGPALSAVISALREVIDCERVYTFTLAEMVPHFHVHIIPRTAMMPRAFRGRGILQYPVNPGPSEELVIDMCERLRRRLRYLEGEKVSAVNS